MADYEHVSVGKKQMLSLLTHWSLGDVEVIRGVFFKLILRIDVLSTACENCHRWVPQKPIDNKLNIGSDNGSVRQQSVTWAMVTLISPCDVTD